MVRKVLAMMKKYLSNKIRREQTTGERIRSIRKRKHVMVKELAKMCDVTAKTMQNYEAGERQANQEKLDLIAEKLGVNPASIYYKFESIGDFFHFLFEAEREGLIVPVKCSEKPEAQLTMFGIRTTNELVDEGIKEWCEEKALADDGKISENEYLNWQDAFPNNYSGEDDKVTLSIANTVDNTETDMSIDGAPSAFKQDGYMLVLSHTDHAVLGQNGTIVPQNIQNRICQFVHCTLAFLKDESIEYIPQNDSNSFDQRNEDTLSDILGIMDKNAYTEHFRVLQVQLSRVVIYNLQKKGFDRNALRVKQFLQEKLDYLFSGRKGWRRGACFGFNFSELNLIRELTGISFHQMFTGEE